MALWGAPRRKKNGAPGGIALKPCGEGCQKSTSSGGSTQCRKCENQPKSVLAMNAALAAPRILEDPRADLPSAHMLTIETPQGVVVVMQGGRPRLS
jgi:hypothetical protein